MRIQQAAQIQALTQLTGLDHTPEVESIYDEYELIAGGEPAKRPSVERNPSKLGVMALLKSGALEVLGKSIGYLQLLGLVYPVKHYQYEMAPGITRGTRLTDEAFAQLHARGFKAVVNLCRENDHDAPRAKAAGMDHLRIPILDNHSPTLKQVAQFLDFVTTHKPVYFHCEAGKGRTGTMAACYRMAVQGWPLEKALAEAETYGFPMPNQREFLVEFSQVLAKGEFSEYLDKNA